MIENLYVELFLIIIWHPLRFQAGDADIGGADRRRQIASPQASC